MLDPCEIFVHRGAGVSTVGGDSLIPENSIEAFEHALASGVNAVELDVWMAADGTVVVIHGAGSDSEGFLFDTVVNENNISNTMRIEQLRFNEERLKGSLNHRRPWAQFLRSTGAFFSSPSKNSSTVSSTSSTTASSDCYDSDDEEVVTKTLTAMPLRFILSETDVERSQNGYRCDLERHQGSGLSQIPTLDEVISRFAGKLRFNVELKGTDPKLGPAVLEIAKKYPGVITRISTFAWIVPESLANEFVLGNPEDEAWIRNPNGEIASDLLMPIVSEASALGIELALLIGGYVLPPLELVVRCANLYKATWIHLPYGFSLLDKNEEPLDIIQKEAMPLLLRFPQANEKSLLPTREVVLQETISLMSAVRTLHKHGLRVLVYGGREHELSARLKLVLYCGIDGLCPNDGALALKLVNKRNLKNISKTQFSN